MTIPMISIDGISMPVNRDGMNLMSDVPLAAVAGQVLERGAAFEAAVEQFQQAMAEFPVPPAGTAPAAPPITPITPALGEATLMPLHVEERGSDTSVASPNVPPAGTAPAAPPVTPITPALGEAALMPLHVEERGSDKSVASPNVPSVGTVPVDVEEPSDVPVLQAAPIAVPVEPQVIDLKNVAVDPVQVVAARVAHQVVATPAQVLIEAASAVADTIIVSPGLLRGTGEVQVQLRPDVLEGTVIRISSSAPGMLTVQFTPVTENMAALLEKCAPQLVTYLSERVHSVQIAVNVKRDEKLKG